MKRLIIILVVILLAILGIEFLKNSSLTAQLIWNLSDGGVWLLPLVIISSLLDSVHPCSFSPQFPIKFKIPTVSHQAMGRLIEQTSIFAALILGLLVGICQFPCMGGPYLMVIGLLHDQVTYFKGVGYLFFYNLILIVPLVAVLYLAADKLLVEKMEEWKKSNLKQVRLWVGLLMIILGFLIFFI